MTQYRPRRSVLYMPAANTRALEKAKTLPADAVVFDFEDGVAPDAKETAREQAVQAVSGGGYGKREVLIRVNALASEWGEADLAAAGRSGADGVVVPKVEAAADVESVRGALAGAGAPPDLPVWGMIETPLGVLNAREIAAAAGGRHPLAVLLMGTNDLAKETRADAAGDRAGVLTWLSHCVAAARACGLDIVDGVYNAIEDAAGFEAECRQGLRLGMDGKTLIHPGQIEPCNAVFSPDADEVAWSRRIIDAFEQPENKGKGVIALEGRMVEILHRDIARRTVAIAEAIAEREAS